MDPKHANINELRAMLAGQALSGLIASCSDPDMDWPSKELASSKSVEYADGVIYELQKKPEYQIILDEIKLRLSVCSVIPICGRDFCEEIRSMDPDKDPHGCKHIPVCQLRFAIFELRKLIEQL